MKTVAIINHCDEWHEYSSFRLIGVVDVDRLEAMCEQIKAECNYTDEEFEQYIDIHIVELNELDI